MGVSTSFLQKFLSQAVLPSLSSKPNSTTCPGFHPIDIPVKGTDVTLSAYIYAPTEMHKKWIIYFLPNGEVAEDVLPIARQMADDCSVNILVFNYRGVGRSTGFPVCSQDLVADGAACMEFLQGAKGVPTENIFAYGHSLGAGVAAHLLANNEKYRKAHLISDRSFSSLGDIVACVASSLVGRTLGGRTKRFFEKQGWVLNSVDDICKIEGTSLVVAAERDSMMGDCRLDQALKKRQDLGGLTNVKICVLQPKGSDDEERDPHYYHMMPWVGNVASPFENAAEVRHALQDLVNVK